MTSSFPNAAPSIQDLARETDQEPPPQECTPNAFLDASLPILIKANEHYQELQDAGIRKEFLRHHTDTEKQLAAQQSHIATELASVEKGFDDVGLKFKEYDGKLKTANCKLNTFNRWVDIFQERVVEQRRYINDKLKVVDTKVERVDGKIDRLSTEFQQLKGKLENSKAERGFHQVAPVGAYDDDTGGYSFPEDVPKTVRDFWRLKRRSRLPRLVALAKAYNVSPNELLQPEGDDASSDDQDDADDKPTDDSQAQLLSLEKLVEAFPERAHQILAHRLGLDYHKISIYMLQTKKPSITAPATNTTNGNESAEDSEEGEQKQEKDRDKKLSSTSQIIVPVHSTSETDENSTSGQNPSDTADEKIVLTLNSI